MRTATLTGPHGRPSARSTSRWHSGTRALEDGLATLGHDGARRRGCCRTYRCQINRTRSGLRHNQPPGGCGGLYRLPWTSGSSGLRRAQARLCCWSSGTRLTGRGAGRRVNLSPNFWDESFGYNGSLGFVQDCYLILIGGLDWLCSFGNGRCIDRRRGRRRWRLRPHNYCGRRTGHRLRRDETRRRLCLHRRCRKGAGSCGKWRCGLGRNSRRRSHRGPRGDGMAGRRGLTRRRGRLGGPLRDGLQDIAGLGDVRKIDLRLELVRRRRNARAAARAGLMLLIILFDALSLVHFNGTGVRLLLGYTDLEKNIEDFLALDLELSGQIVDSNLVLHSAPFPPLCPRPLKPA